MKRILTIAGLLFGWLLALPALAQTVTLNFDDGTAGSLVGGHYSAQGITFQDARWVNMGSGLPGMSGTMGINHATGDYQWGPSTPVIATFAQPASSVSVDGIDVGTQGLVITAFDAPTGGTQVATQQVFGTGVGVGEFLVRSRDSCILLVENGTDSRLIGQRNRQAVHHDSSCHCWLLVVESRKRGGVRIAGSPAAVGDTAFGASAALIPVAGGAGEHALCHVVFEARGSASAAAQEPD